MLPPLKPFFTQLFIPSPKKIWILIGIFLIFLIMALFIFPQTQKEKIEANLGKIKKPKIISLTETQQTAGPSTPITFSVRLGPQQTSQLTKTIKVYQINPLKEDDLEKVKNLAKTLGFQNSPTINQQTYVWKDGLKMIRYHQKIKFFEYYSGLLSNQTTMIPSGEKFDKEKCISVVKQKLTDLVSYNTNTPLTITSTKFLWQTGMEIGETNDLSKANLMEINLTPLIEGYPVLVDYYNQSLTSVRVNLGMEIIGINHYFIPFQTGNSGRYPLLAIEKAIEKIKNGEGAIVGIEGQQLGYDVAEIKSTQLTNIKLAYLSKNDYLIPVYVFTGTGLLTSGKKADVTVFLVAVGEEWME